ncbi:MAG: histidine phosphatase family protein [Acidobacteriota bacterium]
MSEARRDLPWAETTTLRLRSRRSVVPVILVALIVLSSVPALGLEIIVVRHAQKAADSIWDAHGSFRPLTAKGLTCSERFAEQMGDHQIERVLSTATMRTLHTAATIVEHAAPGIEIESYGNLETLKATVSERHASEGRTAAAVLIVGHSNTVVETILALRPDLETCKDRYGLDSMSDARYGDVWYVQLEGESCEGIEYKPLGESDGIDCRTP